MVQDFAPPGGQVLLAEAVLFRTLLQVLPLHQLQEPEAQEQEGKEAEDDQGHDGKVAPYPFLFLRGHGAAAGTSQESKTPEALFFRIRHQSQLERLPADW